MSSAAECDARNRDALTARCGGATAADDLPTDFFNAEAAATDERAGCFLDCC